MDNVITSVNRKNRIIFQRFDGLVALNNFRALTDTTCQFFDQYRCRYFIVDSRNLSPLYSSDIDYAARNLKMLKKKGLELFIFIKPYDFRTEYVFEKIGRKLDDAIKLYMADTVELAFEFVQNHCNEKGHQLTIDFN